MEKQWAASGITESELCELIKHFRINMVKESVESFSEKIGISPFKIDSWEEKKTIRSAGERINLKPFKNLCVAYGYKAEIVITKK